MSVGTPRATRANSPHAEQERTGAANDDLPLQPTRTIKFTTTEGTWISVDVSPDGKMIIFDLLGDLYTLPNTGGTAKRITSGLAFNAQPRFSPDGKHIAFITDRDGWNNLWVTAIDGSEAKQITHYHFNDGEAGGCSPAWSPDGKKIAVAETEGGRARFITEYDVETGEAVPLRKTSEKESGAYLGPHYSHDGRYVYASMKVSGSDNNWQVVRIDRTDKRELQLVSLFTGLIAMRPITSPDGHYLAYSAPTGDGTGVRIRDLRTEHEAWLLRHAQQDVSGWFALDTRDLVPSSAFTPDGHALITSFDGKLWKVEVPSGRVTPIPFTAEIEKHLGPLARFEYSMRDRFVVRGIRSPAVSPDGSRVVFSALDRLWTMDLPSGTPKRLTPESGEQRGEFFPAWSPDGKSIAYCAWTDRDGGAIYRVSADGGSPERLTQQSAFFAKTAYTPDGSRLIAVEGSLDAFRFSAGALAAPEATKSLQFVSLPSAGGEITPIRSAVDSDAGYQWKAEELVYEQPHFVSDRLLSFRVKTGLTIFAMDGSTQAPGVAIEGRGGRGQPHEVIASPDGGHLLLLEGGSKEPYLITLPHSVTALPSTSSTPNAPALPLLTVALGGKSSEGVRVDRLTSTGMDFIGWTSTGIPYYSIGNQLFVAEKPVQGGDTQPPKFRHIQIELQVPRDHGTGAMLLQNARVLTMRGHEVIERGDILIKDGRIAAVGASGTVSAPADAKRMDLRGKTILPGYIDVHDHVGYAVGYGEHLTEEPRLLADLAWGITALRDPAGYGPDLIAVGERGEIGDLLAPHVWTVNDVITPVSFAGDGVGQTLEQTREVLKQWSEGYDSETIKQYESGGRRTRQLVVMAAKEQGLFATNEGGYVSPLDLSYPIDGYPAFEHPIPAMPQYRDVTELLARSGTIQTPTLGVHFRFRYFLRHDDFWDNPKLHRFVPPTAIAEEQRNIEEHPYMYPDDERTLHLVAEGPAKVLAAGGCIGMGSHGNVPGIDAHWEMWMMHIGGASVYDSLRTGTICSARAIGHEQDLGTIAPGKYADLQVLDKNPLDDIRNTLTIRYVMKSGRLYDANTLDEVWPNQKSLPKPWWDTSVGKANP